ncbi:MAG TPA: NADP-dependent oxidoreductase [Acidimicrobiales bacterium]|nr:NADP-dependent oxidoreductase [Acidimicrobiales bacterium]
MTGAGRGPAAPVRTTTPVVVATGFGGPEVLTLVDAPLAAPGPGEVLVEVRAAGMNPGDWWSYGGHLGTDPARLPLRLGLEASGVVAAVGERAVGPAGVVRVGDEVIAARIDGAYAGAVVAPAEAILPKPPELSFPEAAALVVSATTAVHALEATGVTAGDVLVVHGASGGVGSMLVQMAVAAGARVIGTAGASGQAWLRALGAEPVAYGDGLVERLRRLAPDGADAAIDAAGTDEAIAASVALVADRRRIATLAGFDTGRAAGIRLLGRVPGAEPGTEVRSRARLEVIGRARAGRLAVRVARTYPMDRVVTAHRQLASGHPDGKLVLVP